ncbi:MAG: IS91 family transposase, partial [Roseiarcus sp.]
PPEPVEAPEPLDWRPPCPCCGGRMRIIETFERWMQPRAPPRAPTTTGTPS